MSKDTKAAAPAPKQATAPKPADASAPNTRIVLPNGIGITTN